jgi:hypothetical protein
MKKGKGSNSKGAKKTAPKTKKIKKIIKKKNGYGY